MLWQVLRDNRSASWAPLFHTSLSKKKRMGWFVCLRPCPHVSVFKRKRSCFAPFSKRVASTLIVFVSFSPVHTTTPYPFWKGCYTLSANVQITSTHAHFNISATNTWMAAFTNVSQRRTPEKCGCSTALCLDCQVRWKLSFFSVKGLVWIQAKWSIRPELFPVPVAWSD